ncbi:hypothetical protein BH18ACT6_BH18ACT6_25400 [soil metagenome]
MAMRCADCGREISETSHVCETERRRLPAPERDALWHGLLLWVRAVRPYLNDDD